MNYLRTLKGGAAVTQADTTLNRKKEEIGKKLEKLQQIVKNKFAPIDSLKKEEENLREERNTLERNFSEEEKNLLKENFDLLGEENRKIALNIIYSDWRGEKTPIPHELSLALDVLSACDNFKDIIGFINGLSEDMWQYANLYVRFEDKDDAKKILLLSHFCMSTTVQNFSTELPEFSNSEIYTKKNSQKLLNIINKILKENDYGEGYYYPQSLEKRRNNLLKLMQEWEKSKEK